MQFFKNEMLQKVEAEITPVMWEGWLIVETRIL